MPKLNFQEHRNHLNAIHTAIHAAADPYLAVARVLSIKPGQLVIGDESVPHSMHASIFLVAFGKAAGGMVDAAYEKLGGRLTAGVASIPVGSTLSHPGLEVHYGGHPLPDRGSLAAGLAVGNLLAHTQPGDIVLVLISGGGSAMLEWPLAGIELNNIRVLTDLLLRSGAPIEEINVVRKAISRIKSGGIARLAAPAQVIALILSDVVGDRLTAIASGTTVLRRVSPESAKQVLKRYQIWEEVPQEIRTALTQAPGVSLSARRPINRLVGSNRLALDAAAEAARRLGFSPCIVSARMHGEARQIAARFAHQLIRAEAGTCLLMGGETTVTIRGEGQGGRNQEFALAASLVLSQAPGRVLMALATDGVDGPTDAAGAIVSSETCRNAKAAGVKLSIALSQNDSYPALRALNALIQTGPSGTNVNDVVIGLVYP
ncbi:MAG: DUF4147 domain-containing protein [Anaerolineales bacterium]|nr:DUF4147 domain-containing protein [Anaerolineales bacterium]